MYVRIYTLYLWAIFLSSHSRLALYLKFQIILLTISHRVKHCFLALVSECSAFSKAGRVPQVFKHLSAEIFMVCVQQSSTSLLHVPLYAMNIGAINVF